MAGKGSGKAATRPPLKKGPDGVVLLTGGNPQIAKGDGDEPVQAYLAAMPGWKSAMGRRLDALIEEAIPGVGKAVRWNSPFYGVPGKGWSIALRCYTKYVQVSFLNGSSMEPMPPVPSRDKNTRYLNIYEDEDFDEAQFIDWVKQASTLPGWIP